MRLVSRKENIYIALVTICWQERLVLKYGNEFHKKDFKPRNADRLKQYIKCQWQTSLTVLLLCLFHRMNQALVSFWWMFVFILLVFLSYICYTLSFRPYILLHRTQNISLWNTRSNMCLVGDCTVYNNSLESLMQIIFEPIMHAVYYTRAFKFL
jgi:hypothetical protein